MKLAKKLSPAVVEDAEREEFPYRIWDTTVPALFLRVQPSGVKSFNVQWSRTSSKSLGKWPGVTVEAARTRARAALVETDKHGAPAAVFEARKPQTERPITLAAFIREHYTPWALANQKQGQATLDALDSQFGPEAPFAELGAKPIGTIAPFDLERFKSARLKDGIKPRLSIVTSTAFVACSPVPSPGGGSHVTRWRGSRTPRATMTAVYAT